MIYNELSIPRPTGATDFEDSPVCAALVVLFDEPEMVKATEYFDDRGMYQRCPDSKYTVSRDQFIALCVVLAVKKLPMLIDVGSVDGYDIMPPSVKGHVKRCKGLKASFLQDAWLWGEIYVHATFTPLAESNQLIFMMWFADDKFLKHWCKTNFFWKESITNYWCNWRGEPEITALMIAAIEKRIAL